MKRADSLLLPPRPASAVILQVIDTLFTALPLFFSVILNVGLALPPIVVCCASDKLAIEFQEHATYDKEKPGLTL